VTADTPPGPPTTFGEALLHELHWVHEVIRRDLDVVRRLADDVVASASPTDVQATLHELETRGPLWQLKYGCLQYCRHVHGHHTFEDTAWFPGLRAANPALAPVVDQLQAEHRQVAELLHDVEEAAALLGADDGDTVRTQLRTALTLLADHLLAHLAFEEEAIAPTLLSLTVPPWMVPSGADNGER
jgi:hypothetical protein